MPVDPDEPCDPAAEEPTEGTGDPDECEPVEPTAGPTPSTQAVKLIGLLTPCADVDGRAVPPADAWCVDGAYAGDLVSYAAEANLSDLDGDCAKEETAAEITALARAEAETAVTAEHKLVAGEVVKTTVTSFEVVEPSVCDQAAPEADGVDHH